MQDAAVKSGLAALCAVSGMAALGLTDNFVPFITERGSLWQFHFVRGVMAVAFLPLLAGALYAIGAVATRAWCEGESTMVMTAGFFGMLAVMGGIGVMVLPGAEVAGPEGFVSRTWGPLDGAMWFWIAVQAVGSLIGIGFLVRGYQLGEAGHVAIFEYSLLIFASFWAYVLWDQQVPPMGFAGMALIALAGAVIALRSDEPSTLRAPEAVE